MKKIPSSIPIYSFFAHTLEVLNSPRLRFAVGWMWLTVWVWVSREVVFSLFLHPFLLTEPVLSYSCVLMGRGDMGVVIKPQLIGRHKKCFKQKKDALILD